MTFSDPHSFARPSEARMHHADLELTIDFEQRVLRGKVMIHFTAAPGIRRLILDTRQLHILRVTLDGSESSAPFSMGPPDEILGQPLEIRIQPHNKIATIWYETSPDAPALQWLSPAQTAGGQEPFLYTQSQAILCRSWIPVQDSPSIRFTYTATVRGKPGHLVLMSARNPQNISPDGTYHFVMPHPIPAYLMALAAGRLAFSPLDHRTGVYAEPEVLSLALQDFAETPKMLAVAEALYGPYAWDRYDILVMPPAFPFGGMENPCLTFATPTILTGDKSLTSLIAHELAHSWSGNYTTNATWCDFWLNEGFTVFLERRIMQELYGEPYMHMLEVLGYSDLQNTINQLMAEGRAAFTTLHLPLEDHDPDDAVSDIAYEKGYLFLRQLQRMLGVTATDQLLKMWFERHAFASVTTQDFLNFFKEHLTVDQWQTLMPDSWIFQPGLPGHTAPHSQIFEEVEKAAQDAMRGRFPSQSQWISWYSQMRQQFLRTLAHRQPSPEQLAALDQHLQITNSRNSEEVFLWLQMALKAGYFDVVPKVEEFLSTVGRRKFVLPLMQTLLSIPALKEWGKAQFLNIWGPRYHYVTYNSVARLLD
ncbi:MAG: M1 family metallopeptidase [Flavobacteriales bacterium]|nr:M1 family metallopeptidase [Flavobacteriales bacterium]MDW8409592.1 M1 family metallopeptidase [Flavobacteriales bacterium]